MAYSQQQAQPEQEEDYAPLRGAYLGVSVGKSAVKISNSVAQINGATSTTLSKDETGNAYTIFGGYRFNKYLAVEGGYSDLGTFSATRTMLAPASGSVTVKLKASGPHAEAVGILPLGKFALFGKAGLMYTMTENTATSTGAVVVRGSGSQTSSDVNLKLGIGASFDITQNFGVRIEAEQVFDVGDKNSSLGGGDIRVFSTGVFVRF